MKPLVRVATTFVLLMPAFAQQPTAEEPKPTPGISVIKFVAPSYPAIARVARIEGDVRLLVEIAPDGSAKAVTILSGHPMLKEVAASAVKQWRFGCQRCNEELRHIVTITFELDSKLVARCAPQPLAVRCVDPELPNRLIVRDQPFLIEDPAATLTKKTEERWPSPWVLGSTSARPAPVRD